MSIDETAMLLSGQMVRNELGTFYFDQPGHWVDEYGWPDNERLHRLDGPAAIYASGGQAWWRNGLPHREDGPARTWDNGAQFWYLNGQLVKSS